MRFHPGNFLFSHHVYYKTQTFDIWQQTNGLNAQIARILQLQKQLMVFNKIFFKKFLSDVQNVYRRPKHMHSDDIAKVCGKSSRICCSAFLAPEWSIHSRSFHEAPFVGNPSFNANSLPAWVTVYFSGPKVLMKLRSCNHPVRKTKRKQRVVTQRRI